MTRLLEAISPEATEPRTLDLDAEGGSHNPILDVIYEYLTNEATYTVSFSLNRKGGGAYTYRLPAPEETAVQIG